MASTILSFNLCFYLPDKKIIASFDWLRILRLYMIFGKFFNVVYLPVNSAGANLFLEFETFSCGPFLLSNGQFDAHSVRKTYETQPCLGDGKTFSMMSQFAARIGVTFQSRSHCTTRADQRHFLNAPVARLWGKCQRET